MGLHSAVSVVARTARLAARILVAMLRRVPSCALSALLGRAEGAAGTRARIAVDSGEMGRPIQITVIVPCYNEEASITDAVLSALQGTTMLCCPMLTVMLRVMHAAGAACCVLQMIVRG